MAQFINSKRYGTLVQLYKRANGDVTFYVCYNDTSKLDSRGRAQKQRVKIGMKSEGITEQYAKAKYDELITAQRLGEVPESIKRRRKKEIITVQNLAELYFAHRLNQADIRQNVAKNVNNDKSIFNNHLQSLHKLDVDSVTSEMIEKLKLQKVKEISPKTVNNALTLLSAILNYGVSIGKVAKVPKISKISGISNQRERYFSKEEIALILDNVQYNQILLLFVHLSLSTGGRLETIRAIKIKDVNLKEKTINLTDQKAKSSGKTNSTYTGYISNDLLPYIKEAMTNAAPNDYLLRYEYGGHVGMDYIQNNLQELFNRLFNHGLDKNDAKNRAVIHSLRHTFASRLAIASTPIYTIQRLMNHSDIKMTLRYAKLSPDNGKNAINNII